MGDFDKPLDYRKLSETRLVHKAEKAARLSIMVVADGEHQRVEAWFPLSQLREANNGYLASTWIIKKKEEELADANNWGEVAIQVD